MGEGRGLNVETNNTTYPIPDMYTVVHVAWEGRRLDKTAWTTYHIQLKHIKYLSKVTMETNVA